jgi:putative transposase
VQGFAGLKERLLRLEGQTAFEEGQRECCPHRADQGDPPQKQRDLRLPPRVHAELRALGLRCNRKRVARLMRKDGLQGCMRARRRKHTTRQSPLAIAAPDLLERNFAAPTLNRIWTADITYVSTDEGFLYLAFILDVYCRKVVGWSMASHLRTEVVAAALEMAIRRRNPSAGLIHHSDRGCSTRRSHSARN